MKGRQTNSETTGGGQGNLASEKLKRRDGRERGRKLGQEREILHAETQEK